MVKYRWRILNIKKEEEWLEKYRKRGYRLTGVKCFTGRHEFEKVDEKGFVPKVRIDFREFKKKDEFENYLAMFEDSGWKHVAGTASGGIQYFEQITQNADEDIFSDNFSKAERYKRISVMYMNITAVYLPLLVVFQETGIFDFRKIFHLKEMYYTPGLWEMKGVQFWWAFLFETPFAVGRGLAGYFFLLMILLCLGSGLRSFYWYRKEQCKGIQRI